MDFSPNALYQSLLVDLREHLVSTASDGEEFFRRLQREGHVGIGPLLAPSHWWSPEYSTQSASSLNLIMSIFKKYQTSDQTTPDQDKVAVEKFLKVNDHCKEWNYAPNTSGEEELMGSVKEHIYHFWNPRGLPLVGNLMSIFDYGMAGPGSSISALGEDYYTKMWSSPLSATSRGLVTLYEWWCSEKPLYSHAESQRRLEFFEPIRITQQNRLSFVPKDDTTSRTIATEPSLNMFAQRGLGEILESRLCQLYGISLSTQQEWNREAARIGSSGPRENGLCTIDLSSASDSLSLKAARWLFPKDLYDLLVTLRCPSGLLPDGGPVEYHMMSTMGNGYTFPLQTLVFSCIVITAIKSMGVTPHRPNVDPPANKIASWGVFGDDIVCHPAVFLRVWNLLKRFGFTLNGNKTFVEGPFRESCGRDYFKGHDIRGVFVKGPLASRASLHATINNLTAWSYRTGILLPASGRYLT